MLTSSRTEDSVVAALAYDEPILVRVRRARGLTPRIKAFDLETPDGAPLPPFTPGAHIKVRIPSPDHGWLSRSYSLTNRSGEGHYQIAVLLEANSTGGSAWMHTLEEGDDIQIFAPENAFPLHEDAAPALLIAGGIGITPILCMARELARLGRPFQLHYAARTFADMAFADELAGMSEAHLYFDDGDRDKGLRLDALLQAHAGRHAYVCGPTSLIQAVLNQCEQAGWPQGQVHYEMFAGALAQKTDREFELELRQSGVTVRVPPSMTILEAAITQGVFAPFECRRGECGLCVTPILEGQADHRDHYLTEAEHREGRQMCICVSRSAGGRLVLDL